MTSTAEKIASGELPLTDQRIIVDNYSVTKRCVMNETLTLNVAKFRSPVIMNKHLTVSGDIVFNKNLNIKKNLTIDGTLIVQGATTSVATTNSTIEDTLIMLNKGVETDINDSGILIERVGQNGFMGWDELHDTFIIGLTDESTGNLAVTPTALTVGNFVANGDAEVTSNLTVKGNFIHTGILNTSCGIFPTSIDTEGQVLTAGTNGVMEWAQSTSGSGIIDPNEDLTLNKDLTVKGNILHTGILNTLGGIFPTSIGTEGQVLTAGTDGVMKWAQPEGSSTIDPNEDLTLNKDLTVKGTLICEGNTALGPLASTSLTVDHDATLGGDILINGNNLTFGNGESMDNVTDGTLTLNANEVDIPGNLVVSGDFTVYGTNTSVVNITNNLNDLIITLGGDVDLTVDDNKDRGVEFRYFDSEAKRGFMGYDDSAEKFIMLTNATNNSEVFDGTTGTLIANIEGNVTGNASGTAATVTGAAQTAITSVGTLTGLQVDNVNIDGTTISSTGGTDLHIKALDGQQLVLDDTIVIDAGVVTGATSITSTNFQGTLTGNVVGNVTGNVTGAAATVTGAAQTDITSVGTLTGLDVDNININGTTISSTGGTDLNITPFGGQKLKLDNTIVIDAGVVTGATSITSTVFVGALTGNVVGDVDGDAGAIAVATVSGAAQTAITSVGTLTELDVDYINIDGTTISSTGGTDLNITPFDGQKLKLDDIVIENGVVTGATFITSTNFYGDLEGDVSGNVSGNTSGTVATVTGAAHPAIESVGTLTELDVDDININDTTISSTGGTDLNITPFGGQQIVLDSTIIIDAGVVTGATSITSTDFYGDVDGNVTGTAATVTGAAQTAITSVGTLTTLQVGSLEDYINIVRTSLNKNTISTIGGTALNITGDAGTNVIGDIDASGGTNIAITTFNGGDSNSGHRAHGGGGGDITIQAGDGGDRTGIYDGLGGAGGNITLQAGSEGTIIGFALDTREGKITLNALGRSTTIGGLDIGDSSNSNEELRFYGQGDNYVGFKAPALSADQIWVLPDADGSTGLSFETDSSGILSWENPTSNPTGPLTLIDTIYNEDCMIGRDFDNQIDFTTDNNIFFKVEGANQIQLEDEVLNPIVNNTVDLGTTDLQFKDLYINGVAYIDAISFGTVVMTLPTTDGATDYVLHTNGSGTLSWEAFGGISFGTDTTGLADCRTENGSIWIGSEPNFPVGENQYHNIGLGHLAGEAVEDAHNQVAIGYLALTKNKRQRNQTAVGALAMRQSINFNKWPTNVAVGYASLYNISQADSGKGFNTAVGAYSCERMNNAEGVGSETNTAGGWGGRDGGEWNTGIGYMVLRECDGHTNTAIGYKAGMLISGGGNYTNNNLIRGGQNVIIGSEADPSTAYGNNQIVIGYEAEGQADNSVTLGNTSITHLHCAQDLTALSDKRIKKDIQESSIGLEFINQLRPVTYKRVNPADWPEALLEKRFKGDEPDERPAEDDNIYDGLIAQEVESTLIALGATWSGHSINETDGKQSLQYGVLVMPLIKAVQELNSQTELLKVETEYIKQRLDVLESY